MNIFRGLIKKLRGQKGELEGGAKSLVTALIVITILLAYLPVINTAAKGGDWTISGALTYLEGNGYTVYADPSGNFYSNTLLPNSDNTYDIGSSSLAYRDLFLGRNASIAGTATIGTANVTGIITATTGNIDTVNGTQGTFTTGNFTSLYQNGFQVPTASGTPDYVVGVNTIYDDVFIFGDNATYATGYWVKSGATGQVVYTSVTWADAHAWAIANKTNNQMAWIASSNTTLEVPTGRTATYVVAANDAPAHVKAQADEVLTGAGMQTRINAVLTALNVTGIHQSLVLFGSFTCDGQINAVSNVDVELVGIITVASDSNIHGIEFDGTVNPITNSIWRNINLVRSGTTNGSQIYGIHFTGTINHTVQLLSPTITNSIDSTGADCYSAGLMIGNGSGTYYVTEPFIDAGTITVTNSNTGGAYGISIYHGNGEPEITNTRATTTASGSAVYVTEWIGNALLTNMTGKGYVNGFSTDGGGYTLDNSNFYAGAGGSNSAGIRLGNSGSGRINNTNGYSYPVNHSNAFIAVADSETTITGGYFGPQRYDQISGWSLVNSLPADNGRFRPDFTTFNWGLSGIMNLFFTGNNPGVTLKIGYTVGGGEIASGVDISAGGTGALVGLSVTVPVEFAAGAYMYITPSANYTGYIYVGWTATYNYACWGAYFTSGVKLAKITFKNSTISGAMAGNDIGVYFDNTPTTHKVRFENCRIQTLGNFAPAYSEITFTQSPFFNCVFSMNGGTYANYAARLPYGDSNTYLINLSTISEFIPPGKVRTYTGTIATLTENAFNSLDNPFGQAVRVLDLQVYVSTAATATSPNIDCGIGSSATTDYATMFDDLPGETIGFYKSTIATPGTQTVPVLWQSGAGNRYLNHSIKGAAATGMVATYVVTVMGN
jgi:hypothetical protein